VCLTTVVVYVLRAFVCACITHMYAESENWESALVEETRLFGSDLILFAQLYSLCVLKDFELCCCGHVRRLCAVWCALC